jgi:hypothetical protein
VQFRPLKEVIISPLTRGVTSGFPRRDAAQGEEIPAAHPTPAGRVSPMPTSVNVNERPIIQDRTIVANEWTISLLIAAVSLAFLLIGVLVGMDPAMDVEQIVGP